MVKLVNWINKIIDDKEGLESIEESEERIIKAYKELLSGYNVDPSKILSITKKVKNHEGVIAQTDINFYSICPHHFIPFFGNVSLAYEPGEIIIGLGKLKRLVDAYSRRLIIQEDIVKKIAEELMSSGKAKGAFVMSKAKHLCICSRGPNDDTTETITTYALGTLTDVNKQKKTLLLFEDEKNKRKKDSS
jgi:GTP cyclohydrolase I|tara:strand:- start:969 stop:1538 length:570 start_codon:yes stop_codon:yes gene_type:complete